MSAALDLSVIRLIDDLRGAIKLSVKSALGMSVSVALFGVDLCLLLVRWQDGDLINITDRQIW